MGSATRLSALKNVHENIRGNLYGMSIECNPTEWGLFINLLRTNLRAFLFCNSKSKPSFSLCQSTNSEESVNL